jgi:hypothetical protein
MWCISAGIIVKMPHINTWVYMDLESTGLKKERPRVTDEDDDDDEFDDMAAEYEPTSCVETERPRQVPTRHT